MADSVQQPVLCGIVNSHVKDQLVCAVTSGAPMEDVEREVKRLHERFGQHAAQ